MKNKQEQDAEREAPPPLYGDVLDSILSHVPTIYLLPASHVSSTWRLAVASSLRRCPRLKPFLLLHLQSRHLYTSVAYDPHSRTWTTLPPHAPVTWPILRSSLPNLLYSLSPSRLSVSRHPLAATWLHLPPPRVSRVDPVVSIVGPAAVVAGGASDFEDVTRAIETLDLRHPSAGWAFRDPLPEEFSHSSSATCLSIATSDKKLYILDKDSTLFSTFDPATGKWSRTCGIIPDPEAETRLSAIGFSEGRLLLVGLSGHDPDPISLRIWEVGLDVESDPVEFTEIGRMPERMVEMLTGSGFGLTTIGFGLVGDFGYFYNPGDFSEGAVFWEIGRGIWERVERPEEVNKDPTARIVFGCARVGLGDLKMVRVCGCGPVDC